MLRCALSCLLIMFPSAQQSFYIYIYLFIYLFIYLCIYVLLTLQLSISLVSNQLNAQNLVL